MFDTLQGSLQKVFSKLGRGGRLTEQNIDDGLREIRTALLEADVNFKVAKELIAEVSERAVGDRLIKSVRPGEQIVKIFQDVLTEKLGEKAPPIPFSQGKPTVVMMSGLQGSGKTTTTAKLAKILKKKGRRPLLVAADIQRPAAIEQLRVLGGDLDIPVYSEAGATPPEICANALKQAKAEGRDVVILDTAGRLHIDEPLMEELQQVKKKTSPDQIYLVCDAMTGQDAVNSAKEFNDRLEIDGVILTKLDGDTRGGAAISVYQVTGKPIAYVGTGEKPDDLEEFHPDRMASRILGKGDVVSLVEKAQEVMDQDEAEKAMTKLLKDEFTFDDFQKQIASIKKLGSMKTLLSHLPGGLGKQMEAMDPEGKSLTRIEAIISSMTSQERMRPSLCDAPRKRRMARGSGTTLNDVNDLFRQFKQMRQMMKQFKSAGFFGKMKNMVPGLGGSGLQGMTDGAGGDMPGLPSGFPGGAPGLSDAEGLRGPGPHSRRPKTSKNKKKQQKQSRKRNRRK